MRKISEQFFSLPIEEKMRYGREVDGMEGYGNDLILSEQQILDWSDRLYFVTNPEDERRLELWPLNPPSFRLVSTLIFHISKSVQHSQKLSLQE